MPGLTQKKTLYKHRISNISFEQPDPEIRTLGLQLPVCNLKVIDMYFISTATPGVCPHHSHGNIHCKGVCPTST